MLCYDILCCQPQAGPQPALPPPGSCTPPPQHAQQAQQAGVPRGSEGGEDSMVIDLTADSPTSALQQELSRLRAENQRLQLQLEVARAEGPSAAGSGSPWSPEHQQQQGRQLAVGSAPAAYLLPPASPATTAAAQQQAGQQQAQAGGGAAAGANGEAALWPHLQFRYSGCLADQHLSCSAGTCSLSATRRSPASQSHVGVLYWCCVLYHCIICRCVSCPMQRGPARPAGLAAGLLLALLCVSQLLQSNGSPPFCSAAWTS